jgi:drug/metabolite transporter (DMT)-like permease
MIFCHWAFFVVVRMFPANVAAIGTLSIPIIGVFSSALLLGEPVTAAEITALLLVVAALGLTSAGRPAQNKGKDDR